MYHRETPPPHRVLGFQVASLFNDDKDEKEKDNSGDAKADRQLGGIEPQNGNRPPSCLASTRTSTQR
jgi:hypothetical protein